MTKNNLFAFDTDEEAKFAVREESRRLKRIANRLWDEYIGSYTPSVYVRTKKSKKSIKLGRVKRLDAYTWGVELMFDDDLAYHDSVIRKNEPKGHSIMLISEGWKVKKGKHREVKNFGYFEGTDFITKVKKEFDNGARKGITMEVNWAGEVFKKKKEQEHVLKKGG